MIVCVQGCQARVHDVCTAAVAATVAAKSAAAAIGRTDSRNPSGTLLPFVGFWIPIYNIPTEKGYPYCNMVTVLPRTTTTSGNLRRGCMLSCC